MRKNTEWRTARVAAIDMVANDVRQVTFDVSHSLPAFDAGSHTNIRVTIGGAPAIRTYTCIPSGLGQIAVAVKLHPNSRGGSRFMHDLKVGDVLELTVPENRFELSWRSSHYLLMAGGIGVTPIFGMARALTERGMSTRMLYAAQNRQAMPFLDDLQQMLGENLSLYEADQNQFIDLDAEIATLPQSSELYVCGPLGMLEAVKAAWAKSGRPVSRLRYEVFGDNGKFSEQTFEVTVANKNITVQVPPDKTMLDALIAAGVDMVFDCQRGECGLCAVGILETDGEIDHRDVFFSEEEKHENKRMCACVSRLASGKAVIDTGYRA